MGLATLVKNAVESGFNALGASSADGIQTSIVYTKVVAVSYDPLIGKRVNTTTSSTFDIIFYAVRDKEVDGIKIKINDIRLIFPQSRLLSPPSANDYVTLKGRKLEVIQIQEDPASATYTLFVRGV